LVPFFLASEEKVLLKVFRNLVCQLSIAFKNPETTNTTFFLEKGPESAAEYYTAFSVDVRNTSYHKDLYYPYLGVENICKVR
jgi:hypothetical protein